jgi:hypothetical protein
VGVDPSYAPVGDGTGVAWRMTAVISSKTISSAKVRSTTQRRRPRPRAVLGRAAGDARLDAARPQRPAVLVVVVAAVGDEFVGASARPPDLAADRADAVDQRQQLRGTSLRLPPASEIPSAMPPGAVSG